MPKGFLQVLACKMSKASFTYLPLSIIGGMLVRTHYQNRVLLQRLP